MTSDQCLPGKPSLARVLGMGPQVIAAETSAPAKARFARTMTSPLPKIPRLGIGHWSLATGHWPLFIAAAPAAAAPTVSPRGIPVARTRRR